jgi:hypothetical protein
LQAADLLAIESHVKDTCSALAARLFVEKPRHHNSTECVPAQVLLHEHDTIHCVFGLCGFPAVGIVLRAQNSRAVLVGTSVRAVLAKTRVNKAE